MSPSTRRQIDAIVFALECVDTVHQSLIGIEPGHTSGVNDCHCQHGQEYRVLVKIRFKLFAKMRSQGTIESIGKAFAQKVNQ